MKIHAGHLSLAVEGEGLRRDYTLDKKYADKYTDISIEEVTGPNHQAWIINSNGGIVINRLFISELAAKTELAGWLAEHSVPEDGRVKILEFTLNDEIIRHYKSPVSATAWSMWREAPDLKSAVEKIGSNEPSLKERWRGWTESWRAKTNIGVFDRLYGIRRALDITEQTDLPAEHDPYVQARMTTSLESMLRGVMEFGHPVWGDGIVENEGKGLLEILKPVADDVEKWAVYMAGVRAKRLMGEGREHLWTGVEIEAMVALGEHFPVLKEVAKEYAEFNKKMLDFAQESGVINPETRSLWENADYIPFYRIVDDRLVGPLAKSSGIANQSSPIKTLKGSENKVGDLVHNIFANITNLMDASIKNHAALMAVDMLTPTGIIQNQTKKFSKELIPMGQVKKIMKRHGLDTDTMPKEVVSGLQTMFAMQPPEGPGIISVMREGKKEYYFTEDALLYRSLAAINIKAFGAWMNLLRAPKRLLTTWVTLDPGFMISNFVRDSMSAFVLSRDFFVPMAAGLKGFSEAITTGETMRTMIGAGAAFESGYINQGDPNAASRMVNRAMKDKGFQRTVLDSPRKLFEAWKRVGSAAENANRIAVYEAAIRAGKSKAQAAFEAKDLMDFSMGGDYPVVQFLIQTVPFMGARMQGLHRLARGAAEKPLAFALKGALLGMAGMALWFNYREDERYKDLEEWDKDTYFHWWIGDQHFRLPKGFEVGAIFNTIPERIFEYMYSKENDAGQLLMRRFGFMLAETFNANPVPQAIRPLVESAMNKNFFTQRSIESPFDENVLPPDRAKYYTSPTMIELANALPRNLDAVSGKIRSPLHLQNLYRGYTGTLGRYLLMATDVLVREMSDYPEPPEMQIAMYPVVGRFWRGKNPRRTKYEEEFYRTLRATIQAANSLKRMDEKGDDPRYDEIEKDYADELEIAQEFRGYQKEISDLNKEIREINLDQKMTGEQKRLEIDKIQLEKNAVFKEAHGVRPSAGSTPDIKNLIDGFNINTPEANDALVEAAPITNDLLMEVSQLNMRQLGMLDKSAQYQSREK
jgi:hypothetical protein